MAKISLIVPVYNVEACLPQCLDSIRRQTFSDIEIVCVVDGSTDRSEMLLRLYERLDSRIRIVVKENGGLSSARNAGIEACTAPIVMFVDSDDMLVEGACEAVREAFEAHDAEMVTFGAECYPAAAGSDWYDRVLSPRDAFYPEFSTDILFKEQSRPFVWRTACKRDFLMREGLRFDEAVRFGEDQIFHFVAYPKARGVAFISKKLYLYRLVREGSLMATRMSDEFLKLKEHIVIADHICDCWSRDGLMVDYGPELAGWAADFLLFAIMTASPDYRDELVRRLSDLLASRFSEGDLRDARMSEQVRSLCAALLRGATSYGEIDGLASAYLASIGFHQGEEGGRPAWKNKLRHVLPMSALALEERLNEVGSRNEVPEWLMADSAAAMRSLEMLRLELLSSQLD